MHGRNARSLAAVVALFMAVPLRSAGAAPCASTEAEPPAETTLILSPDKPNTDVWSVAPSCETIEYSTGNTSTLIIEHVAIERVEAVPKEATEVYLYQVALGSAGDFRQTTKLSTLWIDRANLFDLSRLSLPSSLYELAIMRCYITSFDALEIPSNVQDLNLLDNEVSSIKGVGLPKNLRKLELSFNKLVAIDFEIPASLELLELEHNIIKSITGITFPDTLASIGLVSNELAVVKGVQWPKALTELRLADNTLTEFEIRRSDLAMFQNLSATDATFSQTSCKDSTAELVEAMGVKLCVIDDDRFELLYRSGSSSNTSDAGSSSGSNTVAPAAQRSDNVIIVIAVSVAVVVIVLAFLGYRLIVARRARQPEQSDKTQTFQSASTPPSTEAYVDSDQRSTREYLPNDVRTDKELIRFRIDKQDIMITRKIASGGFGAIFKASYQGRHVAVKQMLPETLRNDAALSKFMDEIRLCATFDHPKIASFIGVAWSSLSDLSVVIEYMPRGDLWELLQKQEQPPSPRDWIHQWTPSYLRSKASIAQDVAEAVVYLHSFNTPILHRDLKARNVLLDERGNAKLSDFGISREMSVDETMTSGVGTAAWIAPEVLRGERYTEMADMYSLGVLLVELDRCCHPFAQESSLLGANEGKMPVQSVDLQHKNTRIVVLVSTGQLRPKPTPECPEDVQALVNKCLSFDPSDRPSAMEAAYALRRVKQRG